MKLSEKQQIFTQNIAQLIEYIYSKGFKATFGEVFRTQEQAEIYAKEGKGILKSLHCKRLAADINIFKDGQLLEKLADQQPFGDYWVTLNPLNRYGGCFKRVDADHYEMQDL